MICSVGWKFWAFVWVSFFAFLFFTLPSSAQAADPFEPVGSYIAIIDDKQEARGLSRVLDNLGYIEEGFIYDNAIGGFSFRASPSVAASLDAQPGVQVILDRPMSLFSTFPTGEATPTGVERIGSIAAYNSGAQGQGVVVAVLDTGIDADHKDLAHAVHPTLRKDCTGSNSIEDSQGHGTHVSGIVAAAANGTGVVGVAPSSKIVPIKVLNSSGRGSWSTVMCGLDYVYGHSDVISVANMSLGGLGPAGACNDGSLRELLCRLSNQGVVVVVAAGNDSSDAANYVPARYPEVLAVSAFVDLNGSFSNAGCNSRCDETIADFSNYGRVIDFTAPGHFIKSTWPGNYVATLTGSSMATPHVAGAVAVLHSSAGRLSPYQTKMTLRRTADCPSGVAATSNGCIGSWANDKDFVAEPLINVARAVGVSGSSPVTTRPTIPATTIQRPTTTLPVSGKLSVSIKKYGSRSYADLNWAGLTGSTVKIFRNGTYFSSTANDGRSLYNITAEYEFAVCSNSACTNSVVVRPSLPSTTTVPVVTTTTVPMVTTTTVPVVTTTTTTVVPTTSTSTSLPATTTSVSVPMKSSTTIAQNVTFSVALRAYGDRSYAKLSWAGLSGDLVDVYRDGVKYSSTVNDGTALYLTYRSHQYKLCDSSRCTEPIAVTLAPSTTLFVSTTVPATTRPADRPIPTVPVTQVTTTRPTTTISKAPSLTGRSRTFGSKVYAELSWSGLSEDLVQVFINGSLYSQTSNDGKALFPLSSSSQFQLCSAGECTNTLNFNS